MMETNVSEEMKVKTTVLLTSVSECLTVNAHKNVEVSMVCLMNTEMIFFTVFVLVDSNGLTMEKNLNILMLQYLLLNDYLILLVTEYVLSSIVKLTNGMMKNMVDVMTSKNVLLLIMMDLDVNSVT
jgi:hypothetical protein